MICILFLVPVPVVCHLSPSMTGNSGDVTNLLGKSHTSSMNNTAFITLSLKQCGSCRAHHKGHCRRILFL